MAADSSACAPAAMCSFRRGDGTEGSSTEPTIAAAQATVYTPPPRIMAKAFSEVNEHKLDAEWARFFSILPELDEQPGVPSRPTS